MDTVRLRTMTEKSIIGFGKYADVSVGNLFALNKRTDLRWIYYNCSMLTFTDEILNRLGITGDRKINKPGTDKQKYCELEKEKQNNRPEFAKHFIEEKKQRELKNERRKSLVFDRIRFSKRYMAALNQGHYGKI